MDSGAVSSIIAAAAALGGIVIGQLAEWLRTRADKDHERAAVLRAKLEELIDNAHIATAWMDQALATRTNRDGSARLSFQPVELSANARRVHVLALLYFPSLRDDAWHLFDATSRFYGLVTDRGPPNDERMLEIGTQFGSARKALDKLVAVEAEKLI